MKVKIENLRAIERQAYPPHMWMLQDARSIRDIQCYAEVTDIQVIVESDWYLIAGRSLESPSTLEVVDLASIGKFNPFNLTQLSLTGYSYITADLRESTSYPLVMLLCKRRKYEVISDTIWYWGNEIMHSVCISLFQD